MPDGQEADPIVQQFTRSQWDKVCERLRELDLFRIVIGTIAVKNAMTLTIKDADLKHMESSGNALSYTHDNDRASFIFSVHKPDTFIGVAKEQVN